MTPSQKQHMLTLVFPKDTTATGGKVTAALAPLHPTVLWNTEHKTARVSLDKPLTMAQLLEQYPKLSELPPHDRILQSVDARGMKVAFFDMDSTVIENECIDELAALCGVGDEVATITHEAMVNGIPFEESLRKRIQIIIESDRLTPAMLEECYREKITFKSGARELLKKLNDEGVHTVLVSGGFSFFTQKVAKELGFKEHYSNLLVFNNGKLAGVDGCPALDGRIVGAEAKLAVVDKVIDELNQKIGYPPVTLANAAAIGDGGNDAMMVGKVAEAGGLGVAFCDGRETVDINPKLLTAANVHLNHLGSLLHATWKAPMVQQATARPRISNRQP